MKTSGTCRNGTIESHFYSQARPRAQGPSPCSRGILADSLGIPFTLPGLKLEIFTLCESAADYSGKLCILGGFDRIHSPEVPLILPRCAVVARLRVHRIEEGDHKLRMTIADEDGKSIVPGVEAQVSVRFLQDLNSATVNLILQVNGLKLERHGE